MWKTELEKERGNWEKMAVNNLDPIIRIGNFLFCVKLLLIVIKPSKTRQFFFKNWCEEREEKALKE